MSRTARHRHSLSEISLLPRRFFRTSSPRCPTGMMSSVIDTARETRCVYPGFPRWNSLTQTSPLRNFADFTRGFRRYAGKLMHKVRKVFISRFLELPEISNSCSPSLLNNYQITSREWTSQGGRRRLEHCNVKLIRLLARP